MSFIFTKELENLSRRWLPEPVGSASVSVLEHIRYGCFQRSLCAVVAVTSVASGLEVSYEHYKGSYSNPVMYTPVALSAVLAGAGALGMFSRWGARVVLRPVAAVTFADGIIGFFFHVRGVKRKPGGWSLPVTNIVMGPPLLAPLLFGTSAYLGLMASYLRPEEDFGRPPQVIDNLAGKLRIRKDDWRTDIRQGRFQKHLAVVTAVWAFCSGFEALYSHYKSRFRYKVQWSPVLLTPVVMGAAIGAIKSKRAANTLLPAASAVAMANGAIGFYYHARGVVRRPGGTKKAIYNVLYGPPIFAPLLFAACGFLGMMASLLRRERHA